MPIPSFQEHKDQEQRLLTEAFDTPAFTYSLDPKSNSMDRFFLFSDGQDNYRVWFEKRQNLGKKVTRIMIGQQMPTAKMYKKIIRRFQDPLRVLGTILAIFKEAVKEDNFVKMQDGFALGIPHNMPVNIQRIALRLVKRALMGTMFEPTDKIQFDDPDFQYLAVVRKGRDAEKVFDGHVASLAAAVAGSTPVPASNVAPAAGSAAPAPQAALTFPKPTASQLRVALYDVNWEDDETKNGYTLNGVTEDDLKKALVASTLGKRHVGLLKAWAEKSPSNRFSQDTISSIIFLVYDMPMAIDVTKSKAASDTVELYLRAWTGKSANLLKAVEEMGRQGVAEYLSSRLSKLASTLSTPEDDDYVEGFSASQMNSRYTDSSAIPDLMAELKKHGVDAMAIFNANWKESKESYIYYPYVRPFFAGAASLDTAKLEAARKASFKRMAKGLNVPFAEDAAGNIIVDSTQRNLYSGLPLDKLFPVTLKAGTVDLTGFLMAMFDWGSATGFWETAIQDYDTATLQRLGNELGEFVSGHKLLTSFDWKKYSQSYVNLYNGRYYGPEDIAPSLASQLSFLGSTPFGEMGKYENSFGSWAILNYLALVGLPAMLADPHATGNIRIDFANANGFDDIYLRRGFGADSDYFKDTPVDSEMGKQILSGMKAFYQKFEGGKIDTARHYPIWSFGTPINKLYKAAKEEVLGAPLGELYAIDQERALKAALIRLWGSETTGSTALDSWLEDSKTMAPTENHFVTAASAFASKHKEQIAKMAGVNVTTVERAISKGQVRGYMSNTSLQSAQDAVPNEVMNELLDGLEQDLPQGDSRLMRSKVSLLSDMTLETKGADPVMAKRFLQIILAAASNKTISNERNVFRNLFTEFSKDTLGAAFKLLDAQQKQQLKEHVNLSVLNGYPRVALDTDHSGLAIMDATGVYTYADFNARVDVALQADPQKTTAGILNSLNIGSVFGKNGNLHKFDDKNLLTMAFATLNGKYETATSGLDNVRGERKINDTRDSAADAIMRIVRADPTLGDFVDENFLKLHAAYKKRITGNVLAEDASLVISEMTTNDPIRPSAAPKEVVEMMRYNGLDLAAIPRPKFNKEPSKVKLSEIIDAAKQAAAEALKIAPKQHVSKMDFNDKELERLTVEYDVFNKRKHGQKGVLIQEAFEVDIPAQSKGYPEFKALHPGTDEMYPVFHGTGSNAASMILRFGFRVVKQGDLSSVGVAGKMLGDGVYFSNVLDKVSQYVGNGGFRADDDGYIFVMRALLGEPRRNFRSAGVNGATDGHSVVSPEWCVFDGNRQLQITRAFRVKIVGAHVVDALKAKILKEDAGRFTFKTFLTESTRRTSSTYFFTDGMIPVGNGKMVKAEDFDTSRFGSNVFIEPSMRGAMVIIHQGPDVRKTFRYGSDLLNNPKELKLFLGALNGK